MAFSTSDNPEEEFIPSELPSIGSTPEETAIKLRLIPQGAGSRLDSDTVRGKIPVFGEDVPGLQVGVVSSAYASTSAVSTGTTVMPVDDTVPQNTEGDEKLTVTITPTSATNLLYIHAVINVATSAGGNGVSAALFQDSTAAALAAACVNIPGLGTEQLTIQYRMTAGTTSSTTFKIRVGPEGAQTVTVNGAGGARLFGGVYLSSIRVLEVTP